MLPLSAELAAGFAFVCQGAAWPQIGFSQWLTPGSSQQQQRTMLMFALRLNNECCRQFLLLPLKMQLRNQETWM